MLNLLKHSPEMGTFSPKGRDFRRKILPLERTFDNLKKFPGGMPGGCWRLELTDALIGNEVVSCLYIHFTDMTDMKSFY